MQFASGSFAGDGSSSKAISGLGFEPQFVLVKNVTNGTQTNRFGIFRFASHTSNTSKRMTAETYRTNAIISMDSDGFTVGSHIGANGDGDTIHWFAAAGSSSEIYAFSYTGTGTDDTAITGFGFQPDLVFVTRSATLVPFMAHREMASGQSIQVVGATSISSGIKSLDSDGMTLGTSNSVNQSGQTYHGIAFKANAALKFGTYVGNGSSQTINTPDFNPDVVFTKVNSSTAPAWKQPSFSGTTSTTMGTAATEVMASAGISAIGSSSFDVGSDGSVNTNLLDYYYWAFGAADALPPEPVELAGEIGLFLGMEGAAQQTHLLSGDIGMLLGLEGELFRIVTELAGEIGIVLGLGGAAQQVHQLAGQIGVLLGMDADAEIPRHLAGEIGLLLGLDGAARQDHHLRGEIGMLLRVVAAYTGPGTGLVIDEPREERRRRLIEALRAGDVSRVYLPHAGQHGLTGLARVLSRRDSDGSPPVFEAQFVDDEDEAARVDAQARRGQALKYRPRDSVSRAARRNRQRRES